jgi:hypothetical protein
LEDLGNAVRKISIDLNVRIDFLNLKIAARAEPPVEGTYSAIAKIVYPDGATGKLLYIKPGYHGVEPPSVRSYAADNPAFPHESTADQWFGESQFEAYRELGEYIISRIGESRADYDEIEEFIEAVEKFMAPAAKESPAVKESKGAAKSKRAGAGTLRQTPTHR